jgi:micrococcal nuclease
MTRCFYILLAVVFALLIQMGDACAWEGVVVKVLDGDSIEIKRNGKVHTIRLYGIDTPEYKQAYSNKAKQFTKRLVNRQKVNVVEKDIDRYGRIVALVESRGQLVNRELVREGLAWYYSKYCLAQPLCGELKDLERKARNEDRGLWRDENPVSPMDWKRQQKKY